MKRLFILTMLFSAPAFALTKQEAESKLASAQARYEEAMSTLDNSRKRIDEKHRLASSYEGKHEHRENITRHTAEARQLMKQHNDACAQFRKAVAAREQVVAEIGRHHHLTHDGRKYNVEEVQRETKALEPIHYRTEAPYKRSRVQSNY